jgi:hypothetical protein
MACEVEIWYYSPREPDQDNLNSTAKIILDCLQPISKKHPHGLGFIHDDGSRCLKNLKVHHVSAKEARTVVVVREVGSGG